LSQNCTEIPAKRTAQIQLMPYDTKAPSDIQEIIESWPKLSPEIRAAVLAIIESAKGSTKA
jgi:hypothetical protein